MERGNILGGVLIAVGWALIPARWRNGLRDHLGRHPRLLLVIWLVAFAVMLFGWRLFMRTSNEKLAMGLFLGAPVVALALTSWAQHARKRL